MDNVSLLSEPTHITLSRRHGPCVVKILLLSMQCIVAVDDDGSKSFAGGFKAIQEGTQKYTGGFTAMQEG